jgi:hypothetical protein
MTYFNFPVPKVADSPDPALNEALSPIYTALLSIYNDFVYSCGVISPPESEYARLSLQPTYTLQPQNANRIIVKANAVLRAFDLIALELSGSEIKAKKAQGGPANIRAIGYCMSTGPCAVGDLIEVILGAGILGVSGATVGTLYYLAATAGLATAVAPAALTQKIGYGILPNYIYVNFFM